MRDEEREVMTEEEAEEELGERFSQMSDEQTPVVLCPHKVWIKPGVYEPVELEAIACLTRIYGQDKNVCAQCDEEDEEKVRRKGKKEKRRSRDDY